jgi:hypothetical protein
MLGRALVVLLALVAFFFAFLIGSAAHVERHTFGKWAAGAALAWPQGGEGDRCAL